ncbi:hypothetical protein Tco_0867262 [Tanacetum coccineum]
MIPATTPLVGFSEEIIWPLGQIPLLVKIGDEEHPNSAWMNFMVVRSPSPYNGIIGRQGVRRIRAVPSTAHEMLKFPVTGETVILRSNRIIPLEYTMVSGPGVSQSTQNILNERGQYKFIPNITMEEYIQLIADKARGRDQTYNWETATYSKEYCNDLDSFTDFETNFPTIVYNDAPTSNQIVSSEPNLSI